MMFTILPGYGPGRILRPGERRRPCASGSSGPEGTFTEEALLGEADYAGAEIIPLGSLVEVLESVRDGRDRPGVRPPRERHRGHGPGHHRQPGLRLRPPHPARGGARHPPPPHGAARGPAWATSSGWPPSPWPLPSAGASSTSKLPSVELLATNSTADAARLLGRARPGHVGAAHGGHRPTAGGHPLRAGHPGGGRGGPPGQPDPVRLPGPDGHPRPHRPRPDQHRLLPERRPSRAASTASWASSRPATSTSPSSSRGRPSRPWATTASSSTSRATSPTPWSATASATSTPSLAGVKFLGSYPAAGPAAPELRREAETSWTEAGDWVDALRAEVGRQRLTRPVAGRPGDGRPRSGARRRLP